MDDAHQTMAKPLLTFVQHIHLLENLYEYAAKGEGRTYAICDENDEEVEGMILFSSEKPDRTSLSQNTRDSKKTSLRVQTSRQKFY
jgi:hypothetical protein